MEILHIIERRVHRIRNPKSRKHSRALNNKRTIARRQILPRPEDSINRRVVQVEDRVTGGSEEVASRVAADGVVAAAVHAQVFIGEVALETALEGRDVRALEQIHHLVDCCPGRGIGVEVAAQAARVIFEACSILWFQTGDFEGYKGWSEVHFEAVGMSVKAPDIAKKYILLERSRSHTDTAVTRLQEDIGTGFRPFVRDIRPISRHTVLGTVEDGIAVGIIGVFRPRPVRLVTPVSALISQGLLVGPSKVAMPCQEVALSNQYQSV